MPTMEVAGSPSTPEEGGIGEVFLLNRDQVEHYWAEIEVCLDAEPKLWAPFFTKEGLFERALNSRIQVWTVCEKDGPIETVFFTQVLEGDGARHLHVFWIWGRNIIGAVNWIGLAVDRFAEHAGCDEIFLTGRPGWIKVMKPFGGEFTMVTVSRPVKKQRSH